MTWVAGASNGGAPIIDYRVYYDLGSGGSFVILANAITSLSY